MDISWGSFLLKFVLMVKYISSGKGYFCVLLVYLFIVLLVMHRALENWVWLLLKFALCLWICGVKQRRGLSAEGIGTYVASWFANTERGEDKRKKGGKLHECSLAT